MNIHEYQAKELYRQYDVPTARGFPAFSVDEAVAAAGKLPGPVWVVKSQIHAGGRGKGKFKEPAAGEAGGVRIAKSVDEVKTFAEQMLGNTLVTLRPGQPANRSTGSISRTARRSSASFICRPWSTAKHRASRSSCRPKAAWTSSRSRTIRRKRS